MVYPWFPSLSRPFAPSLSHDSYSAGSISSNLKCHLLYSSFRPLRYQALLEVFILPEMIISWSLRQLLGAFHHPSLFCNLRSIPNPCKPVPLLQVSTSSHLTSSRRKSRCRPTCTPQSRSVTQQEPEKTNKSALVSKRSEEARPPRLW